MQKEPTGMVVKGTLIHTPQFGEVDSVSNALVAVADCGRIEFVRTPDCATYRDDLAAAIADNNLVELGDNQYLLPGLVDLHIHAPQWPQVCRPGFCPPQLRIARRQFTG